MAANKLCRICLLTDVPLQEMTDTYLDYFEDICYYQTGHAKHYCCSPCYDSLKVIMIFRNKCLKANKILQEWKKNKSPEKPAIQSLHCLLTSSKNYNFKSLELVTDYKITQLINKNTTTNGNELAKSDIEVSDDEKTDDSANLEQDIKPEEVKKVNFEMKVCDDDVYEEVYLEDMEYDVEESKNEDVNDSTNDDIPNDTTDDEEYLIIKPNKVKKDPQINKKSTTVREYDRFQEIFDVQMFKTIEEARTELLSRLVSEPYLSAQYRCELCYSTFKSENLMLYHRKWHNESSPFECQVCSFRFVTHKSLRNHRTKCHRGKFSCKLCPLVTYHDSAMMRHFEKHQGKTYKCDCGRAFNHMSTYLNHKRNMQHGNDHVCVTCARTFVSQLGLLHHRARAHQAQTEEPSSDGVQCSLCGLTFLNQRVHNVHVLSTHKNTNEAKEMIACQYCGLTFDHATQLKEHKRQSHLAIKSHNSPGKCELCGAEGTGHAWRLQHFKAEHPHVKCQNASEDASQHMCDQCGKLFSSMYVLRDHLNTHSGLRPWACRSCESSFSSYSARSQHEVRHGPALACPYCPARFYSSSGLCMHKRRHVGARTHVCGVCGRAFLLAAQLREHVRAVHQHRRRRQPPRDRRAAPKYHKPVVTRIQL